MARPAPRPHPDDGARRVTTLSRAPTAKTTSMPEPDHAPATTFVDALGRVPEALTEVDGDPVGVDVERADSARYFRRAALVQVGVPGRCALLDAVELPEMPELDDFLAGRRVVLHALENDLEPLATLGVRPRRVADTAVAAAMLGLPTGLGTLLSRLLDVELTGDKERFQRADWAARPITPDMAAYAAGDVVHLPALWAELEERLEVEGRRDWYDQELDAAVERAFDDTRDWTRVKGAARLSPEERALLKTVWEAREQLAREHDIAPNRLIHDDVLRALALDPPSTEQQLVRRSPRRRRQLRAHAGVLLAALEEGRRAPPEPREPTGRRWTPEDRDVFDALRRRRAEVAEELGLDAGVLCPSRPLWRAVAGEPEDGHELCELAGLRPWQAELLAEPLWKAFEETRREA
jgi:ribonuclease D